MQNVDTSAPYFFALEAVSSLENSTKQLILSNILLVDTFAQLFWDSFNPL